MQTSSLIWHSIVKIIAHKFRHKGFLLASRGDQVETKAEEEVAFACGQLEPVCEPASQPIALVGLLLPI